MSDHLLTERMWRGWLEVTGYSDDEMPLDWCRTLLERIEKNPDALSLRAYVDAWIHGYRAALDDIKAK